MTDQFVSYELALKLRDLGFGNTELNFYWGCFAYYGTDKSSFEGKLVPNNTLTKHNKFDYSQFVNAPLWQQAFEFVLNIIYSKRKIREKFIDKYFLSFLEDGFGMDDKENKTSYESEETLEKLIELIYEFQ